MLGHHAELAVVPAELLEERHELVRAVHHLHDVHQRAQQAAALHLHVHREQLAGLGREAEQRRVEVPGDLVGAGGDDREAGPDEGDGVVRLRLPGALGLGREELLRGHRASAAVLGERSRRTRVDDATGMDNPFDAQRRATGVGTPWKQSSVRPRSARTVGARCVRVVSDQT